MKQLLSLIVGSCIVICAASGAAAQGYQNILTQGGVQVMVALDPLGPNNQIAAYIKFVNQNSHKVNIAWTPVITCAAGPVKQGYGAPISLEAAASYEVSLWRSSACSMGRIRDLKVEMEVGAD